MSKFERTKRVKLEGYDYRWKNAYMVFAVLGSRDSYTYTIERAKLLNEINKLEKLEETEDIAEKAGPLADRLLEMNLEILKRQFRGGEVPNGEVYDRLKSEGRNDDEASRESLEALNADDFGLFDLEILTELVSVVLGQIDKKK